MPYSMLHYPQYFVNAYKDLDAYSALVQDINSFASSKCIGMDAARLRGWEREVEELRKNTRNESERLAERGWRDERCVMRARGGGD